MGVFSRVFRKGDSSSSSRAQSRAARDGPQPLETSRPRYQDAWARTEVGAEEMQELLRICTQEMKSRALDMPFLLLPFRPNADSNAAKTFVRSFFRDPNSSQYSGAQLVQELRITEPNTICSVMKWCWSRLGGGVVTRDTYELFVQGEKESNYAKHAFDTFIPLSVESEARKRIVFDFFELLAAIAANGKTNGLGGRKLSRLAGWWAFSHTEDGNGFDGGYRSWARAAAATSHLFFAYLRSLAPDTAVESTVSKLPRSLQALLAQTEYPPETPPLLLTPTSKVVMMVSSVSSTPFALLRRARNFEYYDDPALRTFSDYDDPIKALTSECRRVLDAISSSNSTVRSVPELSLASPASPTDASWTRFEDIGFSTLLDGKTDTGGHTGKQSESRPRRSEGVRSGKAGTTDLGRPATPSWADFMSSGFSDDDSTRAPTSLLLPPEQMLPPLSPDRAQSSDSHGKGMREDSHEPGELAGVTSTDIDETFWWVWMTSLAQEEPASRKAVFGRCAFVETAISGARWLVVEEKLKGAAAPPETAVIVSPKKSRFATFTKRNRRSSFGRKSPTPQTPYQSMPAQSTRTIGPDQQAKVQAAAAALVQQKIDEEDESVPSRRRGRTNEQDDSKTQSVMTLGLQPMLAKEASPALQWARKFDKETTRQQYLGDNNTGKGLVTGHSPSASTLNLETALSAGDATRRAQGKDSLDKQLPAPPSDALYGYGQPSEAVVPGPPTYEQEPATQEAPMHESSMAAVAAITQTPRHSTQPAISSQPQVQNFAETTDSLFNQGPTSPTSPQQIQRKPVGTKSIDKTTSGQQTPAAPVRPSVDQRPATPKKTPAAMAAVAAASPKRSSPNETKKSPAQDMTARKASTRGFRGMFNQNNKRKTQAPETLAAQKAMNGSTLSVEKPQRTPSFLRRNKPASPSPAPTPKAPAPAPAPLTQPEAPAPPFAQPERPMSASDEAARIREDYYSRFEGGEPGPEETTNDDVQYAHAEEQMPLEPPQPQFTANANDSSAKFSQFSQGPLDDVPAFVPDDEPVARNERAPFPPKPMPGSFTTRAAAFLAPERTAPQPPEQVETPDVQTSEYRTPMETLDTDPMDEQRTPTARNVVPTAEQSTEELTALPTAIPQQQRPAVRQESGASLSQQPSNESAADRWAQIRKNAAERRTSEDQARKRSESGAQRSHAHSVATEKTDESEASGEETIESRVARIKARVAELTSSNQGVAAR